MRAYVPGAPRRLGSKPDAPALNLAVDTSVASLGLHRHVKLHAHVLVQQFVIVVAVLVLFVAVRALCG